MSDENTNVEIDEIDKEIEAELLKEPEKKEIKGLEEFANIDYLAPDKIVFTKTDGGFLMLEILGGETHKRVNIFRSFPFTNTNEFISVRDPENKEIGILRDLADFKGEQLDLINEDIERRYFTPAITNIISIKEEYGYCYWEVDTSAGRIRFTSRAGQGTILNISETNLLVIDVDGNRFDIPDYTILDYKSQKIIETYL